MQLDIFLKKLRSEGANIDLVRIRDWESGKLIPSHTRGDSLQIPDEAWWQAVAAAHLLDMCGWTESEVRIGRFYVEEALVIGSSPVAVLDKLANAGGSIQQIENYQDSFAWAVACIKAQKSWPLLAPAEITVHHGPEGLEFELDKSFDGEDYLTEDGYSRRHPACAFLINSKEDED